MVRPSAWAVALLLSLAACGGRSASVDIDAGATSPDAASGTADAAADAGHPTPPPDCTELAKRLDALRAEAQKCCPACHDIQCTVAIPDLCCQISTNANNQQAAGDFTAALQDYKAACGPIACPAMPCPAAPSNVCNASTQTCK
jgi:hypothetical protein